MKIEELPEYMEAHGRYAAALAAAAAADNPQVAAANAEQSWLQERQRLGLVAKQRTELEQTAAALRTEFPQAPPSLYENVSDVEGMRAAAKTAHDAITAASQPGPARPAGQAGQQQNWGPPPATGGGGAPSAEDMNKSESQRRWEDRGHVGELVEKMKTNSGDGHGRPSKYVEEFCDLFIDNRILSQMRINPDGTPAQ